MVLLRKLFDNEFKRVIEDEHQKKFHQYCTEYDRLIIDVEAIQDNPCNVFNAFFDSQKKWINLKTICQLLPDLKCILISDIPSEAIRFDEIYEYIKNGGTISLDHIRFITPFRRVQNKDDILRGYGKAFRNFDWTISDKVDRTNIKLCSTERYHVNEEEFH